MPAYISLVPKKISSGSIFTLLCLLIFSVTSLFYSSPVHSQEEESFDHLPLDYFSRHQPVRDGSPATPIIIDGFENFYLGIDMGECHISENPRIPGQYFVAYNFNGTHYTLNGYDWAVNDPAFSLPVRGDVCTAYDSLGNLYYENMYGFPIVGTQIAKSTDNSVTWLPDVLGNTGIDKNWLAADQTSGPYANNIYTVMSVLGGGRFKRSTDNGATFTETFVPTTHSIAGMMVCVGANGSTSGGAVYVVTNSGNSFAPTYTFYRSTDGGATFGMMSSRVFANCVGENVSNRNAVEHMRSRPYPFITADNSWGANRGRLYLVYASNMPVGCGNKPDIFCRYSTNGGATWSAAVTVNDDPNTQNNNQWHPGIWCDKETGRLYIEWMDSRDTPTSDSAYIYASYSDDGGQTFVENQRISNEKMKVNYTETMFAIYRGDYITVTSNSKTAMLAWTDFRVNDLGSFVAYFPDYALEVVPSTDSINGNNGDVTFNVGFPDTKLYNDTILLSYEVTPTPSSGSLNVNLAQTEIVLTTVPMNINMSVTATGGVTPGDYTITVTTKGPNGTPIHKRDVLLSVGATVTGVTGNTEDLKFDIGQNYPNPFNPVTKIKFEVQSTGKVELIVFDATGREVATLVNGELPSGNHEYIFDGSGLSSGIYFYRLSATGEAGEFTGVRRMVLLR